MLQRLFFCVTTGNLRLAEAVSVQKSLATGHQQAGSRLGAEELKDDHDSLVEPTSWVQRNGGCCGNEHPVGDNGLGTALALGAVGVGGLALARGMGESKSNDDASIPLSQTVSNDELARKLGYRQAPDLLLGCMLVGEFSSTRGALEGDAYTREPFATYSEFRDLVNHFPWKGGWEAFNTPQFGPEISPWDLETALRQKAEIYGQEKGKGEWVVPHIVRHAVAVPIDLRIRMKVKPDGTDTIDEDPATAVVPGTGEPRRMLECRERLRGWFQVEQKVIEDITGGSKNEIRSVERCRPVGTTWIRPRGAYHIVPPSLGSIYHGAQVHPEVQRGNLFARLYDEVELLYTKAILPLAVRIRLGQSALHTFLCVPNSLSGDGSCHFLDWGGMLAQDPAHPYDPTRTVTMYAYENRIYRERGGFYDIEGHADLLAAVNPNIAPAPQLLPTISPMNPSQITAQQQEHQGSERSRPRGTSMPAASIEYLYLRQSTEEAAGVPPYLDKFQWPHPDKLSAKAGLVVPAPEFGGIRGYAEEVFRQASFLGLMGPFEELVRSMYDMSMHYVPHLAAGRTVGGDVPTVSGILHDRFLCPPEVAQRSAELVAANKGKDFDIPESDEAQCGAKYPWGLQRTGIPEQDALFNFEYALKQHFRRETFTGRYFVEVCTQLARLNFHTLTHAEEALMSADGVSALSAFDLDFQSKWFQFLNVGEILNNQLFSAIIRGAFYQRFHGPQPMLGIYVNVNELFRQADRLFRDPEYIWYSYLHQKWLEAPPDAAATSQALQLRLDALATIWAGKREKFNLPSLDGEPGGLEVRMLYAETERDVVYDGKAMQLFDQPTLTLPERETPNTHRVLAFSELKGQGSLVLDRLGALIEATNPVSRRPDATVHHGSLLLLDAAEGQNYVGRVSRQAERELLAFGKFADVMSGRDTYDSSSGSASRSTGSSKPRKQKHTAVLGTGSHDATLAVYPPAPEEVENVELPTPCFAPAWREKHEVEEWVDCVSDSLSPQIEAQAQLRTKLDKMLADPEAFAAELAPEEAAALLEVSNSKCEHFLAVPQPEQRETATIGGSASGKKNKKSKTETVVSASGASRFGRESYRVEQNMGANSIKVLDAMFPLYWEICAAQLHEEKPRILLSSENLLVSDPAPIPPTPQPATSLQNMARMREALPPSTNVVLQSARLGYEWKDLLGNAAVTTSLPRVPPGLRVLPGDLLFITSANTGPLLHPMMPPIFLDFDPTELDENAAGRAASSSTAAWTAPNYLVLDAFEYNEQTVRGGGQGSVLELDEITNYCEDLRNRLLPDTVEVSVQFKYGIGLCFFSNGRPNPRLCDDVAKLDNGNPPPLRWGLAPDGSSRGEIKVVVLTGTNSATSQAKDHVIVARCGTDLPFSNRLHD